MVPAFGLFLASSESIVPSFFTIRYTNLLYRLHYLCETFFLSNLELFSTMLTYLDCNLNY